MLASLRHFARSRSGNVGIIFGLSLVPAVGIIGAAVDYTRASQIHAALDDIADSAALAAVAKGSINPNQLALQQIITARALAKKAFDTEVTKRGLSVTSSSASAVNLTGALQVKVNYTANVPAYFGKFLGKTAYAVAGSATAEGGTPRFIDIYFLVDSSTSMGVGATLADQIRMSNIPGVNCMVACHQDGTDALARAGGANLRFDVIQSAIKQVVAQAQSTIATTRAAIR